MSLSAIALQKFDLAISLHLHFWPALSLAVANQWGGPSSADKRDWLAGSVSELFAAAPDTDEQDVEALLLQVMGDEFEVGLEDSSEEVVAAAIMRARRECAIGDFTGVDALYKRWLAKGANKGDGVQWTDRGEQADTDGSDEEEGEDVEMGGVEVPRESQAREKAEPEVDEEGFTKVVGRRKR